MRSFPGVIALLIVIAFVVALVSRPKEVEAVCPNGPQGRCVLHIKSPSDYDSLIEFRAKKPADVLSLLPIELVLSYRNVDGQTRDHKYLYRRGFWGNPSLAPFDRLDHALLFKGETTVASTRID